MTKAKAAGRPRNDSGSPLNVHKHFRAGLDEQVLIDKARKGWKTGGESEAIRRIIKEWGKVTGLTDGS